MMAFIVRRVVLGAVTVFFVGSVSFFIVSLPAGDYITSYIAELESYGDNVSALGAAALREAYGIDKPIYVQYWKWATKFVRGNFGFSLGYNKPVADVIGSHFVNNVILALFTALLTCSAEGLSWSRLGPISPAEPASFSVWQTVQDGCACSRNTFLPSSSCSSANTGPVARAKIVNNSVRNDIENPDSIKGTGGPTNGPPQG